MILAILKFLAAYLLIILLHELGHILTYKYFTGRWPKINYRERAFCVHSDMKSRKANRLFIVNGVLAGLAVFIALFDVFSPFALCLLLVLYLWGCRDDFKELEVLRV